LALVHDGVSLVDIPTTLLIVFGGFPSLTATRLRVILVLALSPCLWSESDTCELAKVV
jgi:hypothetical protein